MTTPKAAYIAAVKAADDARKNETAALWAMEGDDLKNALRSANNRILRGTKDVEVDFEINTRDLEHLGYHNMEDCGGTTEDGEKTPYQWLEEETHDARRALSDWHDKAHGLNLWAGCNQEPCSLLDTMFRETP